MSIYIDPKDKESDIVNSNANNQLILLLGFRKRSYYFNQIKTKYINIAKQFQSNSTIHFYHINLDIIGEAIKK